MADNRFIQIGKCLVELKPGASESDVRKRFEEHERNYFKENTFVQHCKRKNNSVKARRSETKRSKSRRILREVIF